MLPFGCTLSCKLQPVVETKQISHESQICQGKGSRQTKIAEKRLKFLNLLAKKCMETEREWRTETGRQRREEGDLQSVIEVEYGTETETETVFGPVSWQSLGCRCTALIIAANDALKGSRRRQAVACQQQQQQ